MCVDYKCAVLETTGPVTRVDIVAPTNALLNDIVRVKMVDESGKPIAGGNVLVISPTRESIVLITDANGEAGFKAENEGTYDYTAPGHYLVAYRTTYVVKPTTPSTGLSGTPTPQGEEQPTPPSIAMALGAFAPWIVGLIALLLIALFLATRRKKHKKEK